MAEYHKRAGKLGGTKSSRAGVTNFITNRHNLLHGENALVRVDAVPTDAKQFDFGDRDVTSNGYIIAHSETGHNHVLERTGKKTERPDITAYEKDGIIYLVVAEDSEIVHQKTFEKHETKPVEKGIWRITHKSEYDPFTQRIREVRD